MGTYDPAAVSSSSDSPSRPGTSVAPDVTPHPAQSEAARAQTDTIDE